MIRSILEVVEIESGDVRPVARTVNVSEFITELSKNILI
jgi:hypothetical protein